MLTKIKDPQPPRGLARIFYRLPIWLFRTRLSWLLGERFLLLTHIGRNSGLPRKAVLEVIRHDKESDTYFVTSGWGEKSDWYRNIKKTPEVTINVGRRRLNVVAVRLERREAERELLDYAKRNPKVIRTLARLIGYRLDGTEEDYRALARKLPIVAFRPK
ncbi:MAG: nitroreductase family deazaflavin-dependent oxidoreductase [Candidatus Methanofastidiosia archaeon]